MMGMRKIPLCPDLSEKSSPAKKNDGAGESWLAPCILPLVLSLLLVRQTVRPLVIKTVFVASVAAPGSHRARTVDWAIPPEVDEPASNKDGRKEKTMSGIYVGIDVSKRSPGRGRSAFRR